MPIMVSNVGQKRHIVTTVHETSVQVTPGEVCPKSSRMGADNGGGKESRWKVVENHVDRVGIEVRKRKWGAIFVVPLFP